MNSTVIDSPSSGSDTGECKLLGSFAVLVQGALGALALLSLVYKRWRERPQRPIKIWAFDASKQVFGSVLLHLANLFMSMFSAGEIQAQIAAAAAKTVGATPDDEQFRPNPCSFYLLNLAIDTTLGIPILIVILKVLHVGARKLRLASPPESIRSGNYGDPPRATWWLKQSVIYFIGLLLMKTCVFFIFQLCPWIVVVGDWALKWTEGNAALQIAFVMLIFPLIMNAMQYYIIDTFIKNKSPSEEDSEGSNEQRPEEEGGLLAEDHDRNVSIDTQDDVEIQKPTLKDARARASHEGEEAYDPDRDGDADTIKVADGASSVTSDSGSGSSKPRERSRDR